MVDLGLSRKRLLEELDRVNKRVALAHPQFLNECPWGRSRLGRSECCT